MVINFDPIFLDFRVEEINFWGLAFEGQKYKLFCLLTISHFFNWNDILDLNKMKVVLQTFLKNSKPKRKSTNFQIQRSKAKNTNFYIFRLFHIFSTKTKAKLFSKVSWKIQPWPTVHRVKFYSLATKTSLLLLTYFDPYDLRGKIEAKLGGHCGNFPDFQNLPPLTQKYSWLSWMIFVREVRKNPKNFK